MKKFIVIGLIFVAGYIFGDSALRVLRVAWSEVSQKVQPEIDNLEEHLKNIDIPKG